MQRGDGSYRRPENCETTISKGHDNVGSNLLRCYQAVAFSPMLLLHLQTYMSFLNFVLVSSGCSYSLTVSSITMVMERLGKY